MSRIHAFPYQCYPSDPYHKSNYTRYEIFEPQFRASYESVWQNGTRLHPNDIRFLPLLFVVLAISARLAPEDIVGDSHQKRLTSSRYYWSSESFFVPPSESFAD